MFSLVIIVPVSFVSVLGISPLASFLPATTDPVILIPSSVPCVNVVVFADVYGAVVAGGGHVNIPTFLELQIRSVLNKSSQQKNHAVFSQ